MLLLRVIASFGALVSYLPSHLNVFRSNFSTPSIFIPLEERIFKSSVLKSLPMAPVILTLFDK